MPFQPGYQLGFSPAVTSPCNLDPSQPTFLDLAGAYGRKCIADPFEWHERCPQSHFVRGDFLLLQGLSFDRKHY